MGKLGSVSAVGAKVRTTLEKQGLPRSTEVYAALAASVFAVGASALLATGCGVAHADSGRNTSSSTSSGDSSSSKSTTAASAASARAASSSATPAASGLPKAVRRSLVQALPATARQSRILTVPTAVSSPPATQEATAAAASTGTSPAVLAIGLVAAVGSAAPAAGATPAAASTTTATKTTAAASTSSRTTGGFAKNRTPSASSTDSTATLQALFDNLKPGQTLTLNANTTYKHSGVLTINVPNVTINGNGATLVATNDLTSSLSIVGDGVTLTNLNLSAALTGTRYSDLNQNSLNILGDNATVSNVTITGSAAAGVFVYGATGFTLTNVTVQNTRADGVHITNGSSFGQLTNVTTKWTGDDGIAVVSYGDDPSPSHDIVINSSTVAGTTWGRGLSVVGGYNVTVNNITVSSTSAAGIYIATEGAPYYTSSVSNVTITGGTVTGANTSTTVIHGAVLIYSGNAGARISGVTISGLTVANTTSTAGRNLGIIVDAGTASGIRLLNIALKNTNLWPLGLWNVPAGSYTATGWTLNGASLAVA